MSLSPYPSFQERIDALVKAKLAQTHEKLQVTGYKDHDDHALILPPPERRRLVQTISSSGMPIVDCLINDFETIPNHPSGGFFGPKAVGENFRRLLEVHPTYVDPNASLLGNYMTNFLSYRKPYWNPDYDYSHLQAGIEKYQLLPGIGAAQHFCQDLQIGLDLGWGGILNKIRCCRQENAPHGEDFYAGLEAVVLGVQNWISRNAAESRRMAQDESSPFFQYNLLNLAEMNEWLVTEQPRTFHEACQWILWYQILARMYNGSGSLGRLDAILFPFYQRDTSNDILTDEEAIFHLACLLLRDTFYCQLSGPDEHGNDITNRVSYLVLEAAHRLKIPANIGVCVGEHSDPGLLHRGLEIMFQDKTGIPKFLGIDRTVEGFMRNGYSPELSRTRAYSGCHWSAIPGREYTVNDCVKINFAAVFEVAFKDMITDHSIQPSAKNLWQRYEYHLQNAVAITARCLDFHLEHMHQVFPELVLDLLCHGPIEKGEDASHGGVEFVNLCIDGSALATVADSFSALEQRIEQENRFTWEQIANFIQSDWAGSEGERARLLMQNTPRYGHGGTLGDEYAVRLATLFTRLVKERPTPAGHNLIPGLFSWANTIPMGRTVGATPNGRRSGEPISHGANPDPGFRRDGAPTAMAIAIASVQPGWGNTAPMQLELDPTLPREKDGIELIANLVCTHFSLGGTQLNLNIIDAEKILTAHKDPTQYPDLVVRVTGFSAYFSSLSPEFRQLVVNRIIEEN